MKMWLWTPNQKTCMMAMNSELETNDDPKRQKEDMTLNAKLKRRWWLWTPNYNEMVTLNTTTDERWWLWTPKLRGDSGSERQTIMRWWLWMPNWKGMVALNAQLWTDSYECQAERNDFERRNLEDMVALNAKLRMMTLNVITKKGWWL